jgi:predicted nucleic acid-binding protein
VNGARFIDTNVLIYAISQDADEADKTQRARELIRAGPFCVSTQVLGEFYRATTSPRRQHPLTHAEAVAWVQMWKQNDVRGITVAHVDLALEVRRRFGIGYFDGLIVAAARLAECPILYTEDLADGQDYGGVTAENPFKENKNGG